MAKPFRWTMIALAAALAGLAAFIAGIARERPVRPAFRDAIVPAPVVHPIDIPAFILMVGGAFILILALIVGGMSLAFVIRRQRLRAGKSVVAAWTVPPADWNAFRAGERARPMLPGTQNPIPLTGEAPASGMEIVIGEKAIVVGDGCYGLGAGSVRMRIKWLADMNWIEPRVMGPGALIFIEYSYTANSGYVLFLSRLPVPAPARGEAWRAFEHFQAIIVPEKRARLRQVFAAELAAASGDVGAIPEVEARGRRGTRQQGYSALFGAALGFAYWLWDMSRPGHDISAVLIPIVLLPFLLVGIILVVRGSRPA